MLFLCRDARSHSFSTFPPFSDSDYFLGRLSLPSHPSMPPDSINIQPKKVWKYKNQFIMPQNQVCCSFVAVERWFTYAGYIAETLSSAVVFFCLVSVPGRTLLCVCCQGSKPCMWGDVCAGIPHVVPACICGDHSLFPGLCLTEARVSLCLQLPALVAS